MCAGVLFSVMAGTMVAGMPLGAWFTNNFQYERIIVPAGLLSCGAFAGIGLSDSYVFSPQTGTLLRSFCITAIELLFDGLTVWPV